MQCLKRPEEGAGSPGARVPSGCKPADMGAGNKLGPPTDQSSFLTAEPSVPAHTLCLDLGLSHNMVHYRHSFPVFKEAD